MALRVNRQTAKTRAQYALVLLFLLGLAFLNVFQQSFGLRQVQYALFPSSKTAAGMVRAPLQLDMLDSEQDEYLKWLLKERKRSLNLTASGVEEQPLTLYFRGMSGLGHQLLRLSSAYHLAMLYKIPRIWPTENPVCGGSIFTIFDHLIGEGQIMVNVSFLRPNNLYEASLPFPRSFPNLTFFNENELSLDQRDQLIRKANINNEVAGYGHPSNPYGIWDRSTLDTILKNALYYKDLTDYQLYHQLMLLFQHQHKDRIEEVMNQTRFNEHTVFALHIRTGNGEQGDFSVKRRNIKHLDKWMVNVIDLFCDYRTSHAHYFEAKPLMIFVGTDTGSVIPKLQNISSQHCQIPIVAADQAYPEDGKSVSFKYRYDDDLLCLKGWENMFLDMYMFTKCNSVIAGSYSSFTQAAPMSFVLHGGKSNSYKLARHPHLFCQLGPHGNRMDCFDNIKDWLKGIPKVTWGDGGAPKQPIRHEVTFPNKYASRANKELRQLFQGTALMA